MDLNQLLSAHQRAMMERGPSKDDNADRKLAADVADYADRIQRMRDHYACEGTGEIESWESEGGLVPQPEMTLPPGVTMTLRPEYRVGPYVYSDLVLALRELERQEKRGGQ